MRLVTRNQWHSCGKFTLVDLFARNDRSVLPLFRKLAALVRKCGPVTMIPQKTRVVFMRRVRFVAVYPRQDQLRVGIVLASRQPHPRFLKIESLGRAHVHTLRVRSSEDLDATLLDWLRDSYRDYDGGRSAGTARRAPDRTAFSPNISHLLV